MKTKAFLHKILYVIAALLFSLFCCFESALSIKANAETTTATNPITAESDVLDDLSCLQSDDTSVVFNESDYPAVAGDYSLTVLTIVEGANKELFVYVYQPCHDIGGLEATSISISTLPSNNENAVWYLYSLNYLDNSGVFDKYQVNDFTVSDDDTRFYDIPRISRPYNEDIDSGSSSDDSVEALGAGQTVNEVPYEVGVLWEVKTVDGLVTYHTSRVETITITDKIVGHIDYDEGFKLYTSRCSSHFVAFSTDKQIDNLLQADVAFLTQSYTLTMGVIGGDNEPTLGGKVTRYVYLEAGETGENKGDGWFGKVYTWARIESVSDFIENTTEDITYTSNNTLKDISEMQWVLRFFETEYTSSTNTAGVTSIQKTIVSDVSILRLKFVTDGKPYNLGVVDNSQTGPDDPLGGADTAIDDFMEEVEKKFSELVDGIKEAFSGIGGIIMTIVIVVGGLLLLSCIPAVGSVFGLVFGAIFKVIGWILKGVFWVIAFPFNLIGKLFKRNKKNE